MSELYPKLPEIWKEWSLSEKIGEGTYGEVYKAAVSYIDDLAECYMNEIKLGDFGFAEVLGDKKSIRSDKKGTKYYMSPEMYGGKEYDQRTDIYSLGIVLYKLLNRNRDPFVSTDKQIVYYKDREQALQRRLCGEELPKPVLICPV